MVGHIRAILDSSFWRAVLACLALAHLSCAHRPAKLNEPHPLEGLSWMVGRWEGTTNHGHFEETWTQARGGTMLGVGREISAGRTIFFEFMRIEARSDGIYFVPQPRGKPGHDFKLVVLEGQRAVFENAGDDRLHRITYARRGDGMSVRLEGEEKGKPIDEEIALKTRRECLVSDD